MASARSGFPAAEILRMGGDFRWEIREAAGGHKKNKPTSRIFGKLNSRGDTKIENPDSGAKFPDFWKMGISGRF